MTVATQRYSLADFLPYEDGSNTRYELLNGELIPMAVGTGLHGDIIEFLQKGFQVESGRQSYGWVARQSTIAVQSPRGGAWDTLVSLMSRFYLLSNGRLCAIKKR